MKKENEKTNEKETPTPILGILPTATEAEIEARFRGYVQGVNASAEEATARLQREAASKVGEAHRKRAEALKTASAAKQRAISDIEARFRKEREVLENRYRRELADAENRYLDTRETATRVFDNVVKPMEVGLEEEIRVIANDTAEKIAVASAEFTPLFEKAKARRIAAEKETKTEAQGEAGTRTERFSSTGSGLSSNAPKAG